MRVKNFKKCVICGKMFACRPSFKTVTCSKDCSAVRKSRDYAGYTVQPRQRYGRLVTVSPTEQRKHGCVVWLCNCDCRNTAYVRSDNLVSGDTQSCGCYFRTNAGEHICVVRQNTFIDGTNAGRIRSEKVQANNACGIKGIGWHKKSQKWVARLTFKNKTYNLGYYDKIEDAAKARAAAEEKYFKPFLESLEKEKAGD